MIIRLNATLERVFVPSIDAWNGFQGGTLDSSSLSKTYRTELS